MHLIEKLFGKKSRTLIIIAGILCIVFGSVSSAVDAAKFEKLTATGQLKSNASYSANTKNVQRVASEIPSADLTGLQTPNFEYTGDYDLYSLQLEDDSLLVLSVASGKQALKSLRGHLLVLERNALPSLDSVVSAQEKIDGKSYGGYVLWLDPSSLLSSVSSVSAIVVGVLLILCVLSITWADKQRRLQNARSSSVNGMVRLRGFRSGGDIYRS